MTIGAVAELKSIDEKHNSLVKALKNPVLHRIASKMMAERIRLDMMIVKSKENK